MPAYLNPASSGESTTLNIFGSGLWEYVGLESAPRNLMLLADTPFKIGGNVRGGAGLNYSALRLGSYSAYKINVQISLKFKLGNGVLSVGIQPGFLRQRVKNVEQLTEDNDIRANVIDDNRYARYTGDKLDAAVGTWFSVGALWLGLSVAHLFSKPSMMEWSFPNDGDAAIIMATGRSVNIMAGYDIVLKNKLWELVPSAIYYNMGSMNHGNITLRGIWKKMLTIGVGYGWKESVSLILAAELGGVYLGYNYDCPVHGIGRNYRGNHCVVAGYRLKLDFRERNNFRQRNIRLM